MELRVKGRSDHGIRACSLGGTMWATVTLQPGDYTLVCFLPDPKTGKPHVKLGMRKTFTVK
jgi:hypothetical protein